MTDREILELLLTEMQGVRSDIDSLILKTDRLEERMDRMEQRMDRMEQRMDRMEQRMDHLEQRMDRMEQRMDRMEERMDRMEQQMDHLEQRMDRDYSAALDFYGRQQEHNSAVILRFDEINHRFSRWEYQTMQNTADILELKLAR